MNIIKFSIKNPVTVIVGVIFMLLFGIIAMFKMPYQLSPTVTEPEITVQTTWHGATPYEIERDIIEEQEKVLKGIPRLVTMESSSFNQIGKITLRFKIGMDIDNALLRVSNKLDEVEEYPENVDKPVLKATGSAASPVVWMILKSLPKNNKSIYKYFTFFDNEIRQYLERVEGVADLFIFGGREKEMQVIADPVKLAAHRLTISDLINALTRENVNISAGTLGVGRRKYRIRSTAEFKSPESIENVVVSSTGQKRILVSDVAKVGFGYAKITDVMLHNKEEGIAVGVQPEPDTNILDMTNRLNDVVAWLNEDMLKKEGIFLDWVYDQRPYINGAIELVKKNIAIGGVLAVIVLIVFLQSLSSTMVVAFSIPISVIGTFIFLQLFGRNLNVVSLAGISFAVGMLVDNAIVVLENIDRHRRMNKSPFLAAYDGAKEVWGAVLASTLTTVAVFLPVVFMEEEAGQLFKDIAIAVTCSISLSLFVSVSLIPMLSKQLFALAGRKARINIRIFDKMGAQFSKIIIHMVELAVKSAARRIATIAGLTISAILIAWFFFPKMEYLPQGNRNLIMNIMVPPPGLSCEELRKIGEKIFEDLDPLFNHDLNGYPGLKHVFYVGSDQLTLFGAVCLHEQRASELIPLLSKEVNSFPGIFGISLQSGIFENRIGTGRSIDVDISGKHLEQLIPAAGAFFNQIMRFVPGSQIRPLPSLEMLYPEINFIPKRDRIIASKMDAASFGINIDVLMDGRQIDDYKEEGEKTIDLVLKASEKEIDTPQAINSALIATPSGAVAPISTFMEMKQTTGLTEIRHIERTRTITLRVTPPKTIPLQQAMEIIENRITPDLKKKGLLKELFVNLSGAADKLTQARKALQWNLLLALVITYLLMSALFANFIYPLIILFTVPLAGAGGLLGLRLSNIFIGYQPMDVLTMLGFIILIGVVVNNAILIVHQSLNNVRYHRMGYKEAVINSTKTRLRPIYMSASTSIFGMLPLAVAPGPGSELYRGLGSVVLGGLALSTIFTVFVIPAFMVFFIRMEKTAAKE